MQKQVDSWIEEHREEMISALQKILSYRSVSEEGGSEQDAPFGRNCAECLQAYLSQAEDLGFAVGNVDGYAGYAEAGSGEEMMGILCHLDVVPEGKGWTHDPFGGEIADGRIYGRGALDDKGPAVAALYALAAVCRQGKPLKKKVRIIAGCNEEGGMSCLRHYKTKEAVPDFSVSPDADFPLTNSEKSIVIATVRAAFSSGIQIRGGSAHNIIPGEAFARVPFQKEFVQSVCDRFAKEEGNGFRFIVAQEQGFSEVRCCGKQGHAAMPENGHNAIQGLLMALKELPWTGEDKTRLEQLADLWKMECYGESFGLDQEDVSGRFTINLANLQWDENGYELVLDARVPTVCLDKTTVESQLRKRFAEAGAMLAEFHFDPGYSIPDDSSFVQTLLQIYRDRTGEAEAKPLHIGGGTYSRALPMAVSFGPEKYMCESGIHCVDEFIGIEQLLFNAKILADAIIALCT